MHLNNKYTVGIILSEGRKFCTKIGGAIGASHDAIYRCISGKSIAESVLAFLVSMVRNCTLGGGKSIYIIDDTALSKRFARFIEGTAHIYDAALGRTERSLCIVVLSWSNGVITVPLGFRFWFSKESVGESRYKTKKALAQELILSFLGKIRCDFLLMDGLYCDADMIKFCNKHGIKFETKIARNRVVTTRDGTQEQIQNHPRLRLKGNERIKTVAVQWHEINLFITVIKRKTSNGYTLLYLASNADIPPKEHYERYGMRWHIELFFRTAKQSLGIADCASRSIEVQENHIWYVLLTYALLQHERGCNNPIAKNPETIIKIIKDVKCNDPQTSIARFNQILHTTA